MKDFGIKLKEWRDRHDYSQGYCVDEVNKKAGSKIISQAHWSQYEKGLFTPKQKIAGYMKAAFKDMDFIEADPIVLTSSNNISFEEMENIKDLKTEVAILRTQMEAVKQIVKSSNPELYEIIKPIINPELVKYKGNEWPQFMRDFESENKLRKSLQNV